MVPPVPRRVPYWETGVLAALTLWLYAPILLRLSHQWWTDPNFSHGFFVPAFSLFVLWQNREKLQSIPLKPSSLGLPIIILSLCTLILGVFGAELFLSRTSLIFLLAGLVIFFCGWEMLRAVLFPLAFLLLMVPIPSIVFSQITFPLQILASKLAAWTLPVFGVPVLREGNVINLPAMPLEVAEACSGIRSLLSLTSLAIMYGYLMEKKVVIRVILALASIPIAVFANGFRIVG
ncbi:MAG TPA: exosortase, partial [Terriglobales bacterium]